MYLKNSFHYKNIIKKFFNMSEFEDNNNSEWKD